MAVIRHAVQYRNEINVVGHAWDGQEHDLSDKRAVTFFPSDALIEEWREGAATVFGEGAADRYMRACAVNHALALVDADFYIDDVRLDYGDTSVQGQKTGQGYYQEWLFPGSELDFEDADGYDDL